MSAAKANNASPRGCGTARTTAQPSPAAPAIRGPSAAMRMEARSSSSLSHSARKCCAAAAEWSCRDWLEATHDDLAAPVLAHSSNRTVGVETMRDGSSRRTARRRADVSPLSASGSRHAATRSHSAVSTPSPPVSCRKISASSTQAGSLPQPQQEAQFVPDRGVLQQPGRAQWQASAKVDQSDRPAALGAPRLALHEVRPPEQGPINNRFYRHHGNPPACARPARPRPRGVSHAVMTW